MISKRLLCSWKGRSTGECITHGESALTSQLNMMIYFENCRLTSVLRISLDLKMRCYHLCRAVSQNLTEIWLIQISLDPKDAIIYCSSPLANFSQSEIGKPMLDVVLEPGDLLYFPRGVVHQGDCLPDVHSLHITISSFQRNSWGDLLLKVHPVTFIQGFVFRLSFEPVCF